MNYYELLELNENDSAEVIMDTLNKLNRSWQRRTNAPSVEKRQEAEKMLLHIQEAKKVFISEEAKINYDTNQMFMRHLNEATEVDQVYDGLLEEMLRAEELGNIAEAMIVAKQASLKYPKDFVMNFNYAIYLERLDRETEALTQFVKAVDFADRDDFMLPCYERILYHLYNNKQDYNLTEKYLNRILHDAKEMTHSEEKVQLIIQYEMALYNYKGRYDDTIGVYTYVKNKYQIVIDGIYIQYLDALKLKSESLYNINKQGNLTVTSLEQIGHIEQLLNIANDVSRSVANFGNYDASWIEVRLNYLEMSKKPVKKPFSGIAKFICIMTALSLLLNLRYGLGYLFYNLSSNVLTILIAVGTGYYGFSKGKPQYEKNKKDL